ncbi:hypothetical protein [Pelagicoccus sp. SDUM812002]|uniref:hypothetical protein n=1 Tax=Pelagicoccus sp. SDUM812002 TaxID=3041266 RepID=UPI002810540A|nr:hypothetical protein [Pelagicoccus sp. SDUM812002]MDQ8184329.1 hypothetical protein [Pelagicoccus sp. SDUM812002]
MAKVRTVAATVFIASVTTFVSYQAGTLLRRGFSATSINTYSSSKYTASNQTETSNSTELETNASSSIDDSDWLSSMSSEELVYYLDHIRIEFASLDEHETSKVLSQLEGFERRWLLAHIASENPFRVLELRSTIGAQLVDENSVRTALRTADPVMALDWIWKHAESPQAQLARLHFLYDNWVMNDSELAVSATIQTLDDSSESKRSASALLRAISKRGNSQRLIEASEQIVKQEKLPATALTSITANLLIRKDPAAAIEWLASLDNPSLQIVFSTEAVEAYNRTLERDSERAKFVDTKKSPATDAALDELFKRIYTVNPQGARSWVQALKNDPKTQGIAERMERNFRGVFDIEIQSTPPELRDTSANDD